MKQQLIEYIVLPPLLFNIWYISTLPEIKWAEMKLLFFSLFIFISFFFNNNKKLGYYLKWNSGTFLFSVTMDNKVDLIEQLMKHND